MKGSKDMNGEHDTGRILPPIAKPAKRIRVTVVDDHPVVLEGMKSYLATQEDIGRQVLHDW